MIEEFKIEKAYDKIKRKLKERRCCPLRRLGEAEQLLEKPVGAISSAPLPALRLLPTAVYYSVSPIVTLKLRWILFPGASSYPVNIE